MIKERNIYRCMHISIDIYLQIYVYIKWKQKIGKVRYLGTWKDKETKKHLHTHKNAH